MSAADATLVSPSPVRSPERREAPAQASFSWDDDQELVRFTRFSSSTSAESSISIEGMDCAACSFDIENALKAVDGVDAAHVHPVSGRALVRWDPSRTRASLLVEAIERAGYHAWPAQSIAAEAARTRDARKALWRLFVAGFCMMQVMMYAVPAYVAEPGTMSADIAGLLQWASWLLTLPVVLFSASPFFAGALADLRRRRIGMDVPVALGVAVTFVASTGAAFAPGGPFGTEPYFDSLTMFVFFLLGGRYLEMRARNASALALERLAQRIPETAELVHEDGRSQTVASRQLRTGDLVRVRAGQTFPADGRVVDGKTQVDESLLTGESRPLPRSPGDGVVAGSSNVASPVVVRLERVAEDTRLAGILSLMERASLERPAIARLVDRFAGPFLWAVLVAAAVAAAAWSFVDPQRSVWVAVSVLIVTCPCALSLATPSALLASTAALAKRGVLVRRLGALETLAKAQLFVFDKTGTLTEDRLVLADFEAAPGFRSDELMTRAAALAQASVHPLSRAIADAWPAQEAMDGVEELVGLGVQGRDAFGRTWRLGAPAFVTGVAQSPVDDTTAWLSVDGRVAARFRFREQLRPDAKQAIDALRSEGIDVALLSGDTPAAVQRIAAELGIETVIGGASPEAKLAFVTDVQDRGVTVAMVGDGVNDGPVVARADVSIALGERAPLVCARADFTALGARVADVVAARRLAVRTIAVLRQGLAWAAIYNFACIPLAMAGWLPPWLAGLGVAASSLAVASNAARLARAEPDRPVPTSFVAATAAAGA